MIDKTELQIIKKIRDINTDYKLYLHKNTSSVNYCHGYIDALKWVLGEL